MYDPNDYTSQPSVDSGTHEADGFMQRGGIIGAIRSLIIYSVQWYIWRFLFYVTLIAIISWFGVNSYSDNEISDASTHLASGGIQPILKAINKKGFKSTRLNMHPHYNSPWSEWFKRERGVEPKDIYQYAKNGKSEFFVMKDVFHATVNGKTGPLLAEYSTTLIGKDASEYCEDHGGYIANNFEVSKANIQRKGEGFEGKDGWNGKKMFRCVITQLEGAE